ncbi:GNAT family N-acetyltransferase [Amphibacillus marinus]|nr:GNAT family N-acetyltransferase [Amphibacillus marinus]
MKFTTERLTIRPFEPEDMTAVFAIYQDENVCKYLLHNSWTQSDLRRNFTKKLNNNKLTKDTVLNLAVLRADQVIGDLSVWYTDMKDTIEIGYSFLPVSAGQGYATEAVKGLINMLFDTFGCHRIQANLDARNRESEKLCQRVGMRKEAHFIQDFWNKGEWTDSLVYGLLQTEHLQGHA